MPVMDGVEATRRIMADTPCAILIVTATLEGNMSKVFEALGAGALDVVRTPALAGSEVEGARKLTLKIGTLRPLMTAQVPQSEDTLSRKAAQETKLPLIAIGASAGGPGAIATILGQLPVNFPAAIVIVQHLDEAFIPSFADWLKEQSVLPVRIAKAGDFLQAGTVFIAGTSDHLVILNSQLLSYTAEPEASSHRPSIDVFFQSAARHWKGRIAGVLLTGMGNDGSRGLKALRDRGSLTIAQDSASCVVYGMPKAAVESGAAAEILPLPLIAGELVAFIQSPL